MPIQSKNPATGKIIKTFKEISDKELEQKLANSAKAYKAWRDVSIKDRVKLMLRLATYLEKNKKHMAKLATLEMGKTLTASLAEVEKCILLCEFYAKNAEKFLADEVIQTEKTKTYVRFDPLGTVLAVMPWNFPFWQAYRALVPALLAGNVMVLKHASNVPQCAQAIEKSLSACGFPKGVYQNLPLSSGKIEKVMKDSRVVAVTLTGSEKAGSQVAQVAGKELKKAVLELGGSDPFIVLRDADVKHAASVAVKTRMQNNVGQSCVAAKRFIVHKSVADKFTKHLVHEFSKLKIGDPMSLDTDVGPLSSEQGLHEVVRQVEDSKKLGARVSCGGKRYGDTGYFYEPTILTNVKKGMPVYDEEVFAPVAPIITFNTEDEAIKIANDTPYGLGSTIFSKNIKNAEKLARRIEAGSVFINDQVRSDPRLPFGGIKKSGFGRELSHYGIKEFVNIKTVSIK